MVAVLVASDADDVVLGSDAVAHLAALGVSSVALLRDRDMICLVLEGWALDAVESARAAVSLLGGESREVRTLRPLVQLALSHSPP